jgi:hypothetical protein
MPWQVLPNQTEIVAIHAALLPTSPEGDVLYFGDWVNVTKKDAGPTLCRIYHMASQTVERFTPTEAPSTNAFCAGQAFMARGWLLVGGGTVRRPDDAQTDVHDHLGHWDGERACWVYRPDLKRWLRVADLNFQPGSSSKGGGRWYPMLVALGSGDVFAAGGHPSYTDDYAPAIGGGGLRHNNNTPERYSPSADSWTMITSDITALNGVETDEFPRFRLLPSGLLFTACPGIGAKRLFDPSAGQWTGPNVNVAALPADYGPGPVGRGSSVTSVLLPLLPPSYVPRVLATNSPHPTSFLIEINANPAWQAAPPRQGTAAGLLRSNACAVVLPTGQVLVVGGTRPNPNKVQPTDPDALGDLEPELYTPDIDWTTGDFTGPGSWATVNEAAAITRGYHSVALLLPDGRVWTAGTTEGWVVGLAQAEKRVEVFSPWYVGQPRPQILSLSGGRRPRPGTIRSEGYNYGETFTVRVNGTISRVALLRCGSVTHGYDSDQRYIGLDFSQQGDQLTVTAPPDGNTAPPGYYMLWVIDDTGMPCERARFVHLPKIRRVMKKPPIHVRPNKPKHPSVGPKKGVGPKRGPGPKKGVAPKKRVVKKGVGPRKGIAPKKRVVAKKRVGKAKPR